MLRAVVMFRVTNRLTEKPGSRATLTRLWRGRGSPQIRTFRKSVLPIMRRTRRGQHGSSIDPSGPVPPEPSQAHLPPPTPKGYAQACRLQLPLLIESEDLRVA